jgi:hypothetical protein
MTTIKVAVGHTANLGNFENVRAEITVETETRPDEKVADAIDRTYSLAERKLIEKVKELVLAIEEK